MIRRRLYNPAQLTPGELKESFVAREETLTEMLRVIGGQMPGRPCQHMMLIGPRGMGKTTLGLRFLYGGRGRPEPGRAVAARSVSRGELRDRKPGGIMAHRTAPPDARHRGSSLG